MISGIMQKDKREAPNATHASQIIISYLDVLERERTKHHEKMR
jgi:hypothetical protein